MRASRESWGRRAPNATKKARGAEHRKRHAVLMCSCGAPRFTISPTFGRSRSTASATVLDRQQTALTREWRENEPPRITDPHPAPSSARPRCTELRRSEQGQHSARGQHRGSSGVIAFTIRRAVCRCQCFCRLERRRHDGPTTSRPLVPRCRCRPGRPGAARGVRNR